MRDTINKHIYSLEKEAIGAFYFNNLIFLQGIINAALNKNKKIFVMVTAKVIDFLGIKAVLALKDYVKRFDSNLFFMLDHGSNLNLIELCIQEGFDAIMFDGGNLPLIDNISITKKIVEIAHSKNVWVEGELGEIAGTHYKDHTASQNKFPKIKDVEMYVKETQIDALAVSFGVEHMYKEKIDNSVLDFELLKQYRDAARIPLVMHGADTIPLNNIKGSIENGVKKVNYGPVMKDVFLKTLASRLEKPFIEAEMREILELPRKRVEEIVVEKINDCSTSVI